MRRDALRRAGALERLGALLRRGVPAADALASIGAGPRAVALASEGRPVDEALSVAGLVDASEAGLVRAGEPSRGLALLGQELRARHEVARAFGAAAVRPFVKLAAVLVVLVVINAAPGGAAVLTASPAARLAPQLSMPGQRALQMVIALGALAAGASLLRTRLARRSFERVGRDLPVISTLLELEVAARYLRALGTALGAGLDLPAALERARGAFAGRATARDLERIVAAAREGEGLVSCLGRAPLSLPTAQWIAGAAAERADPARDLLALAASYEERLVRESVRWSPLLGGVADLLIVSSVGGAIVGSSTAVFKAMGVIF